MTERLHTELQQDQATAGRTGGVPALEALAAEFREHRIWTETLPGREQPRFVARRRPGSEASPYLVMTSDFAEFQAALWDGRG